MAIGAFIERDRGEEGPVAHDRPERRGCRRRRPSGERGISATGMARWIRPAMVDGRPVSYSGTSAAMWVLAPASLQIMMVAASPRGENDGYSTQQGT
jgi:hypothetical protein